MKAKKRQDSKNEPKEVPTNQIYLQELRLGYALHSTGAKHIDLEMQELHARRLDLCRKADKISAQMLVLDDEIRRTSAKYHIKLDHALKYKDLLKKARPGQRGGIRPRLTQSERESRLTPLR